jgi:hypothetical protein
LLFVPIIWFFKPTTSGEGEVGNDELRTARHDQNQVRSCDDYQRNLRSGLRRDRVWLSDNL